MSETNDTGFGEPTHGSGQKGFPEGLKDGVNEFRILPPILAQKSTGKYHQAHSSHFGYFIKGRSGKDRPVPFYCTEESKWVNGKLVVLAECPECAEIKRIKDQVAVIEADMKKGGKSDVEVAQMVASPKEWLSKHNRDYKVYINAKLADGRYATLKLPNKSVYKVIESTIAKYKTQRIPIDAVAASQGLWFQVVRSGKGFKTEYSVSVVMEQVIVNGQIIEGAERPKLAPLTSEDARKATDSCCDICDVGIRQLAREDVARLVAARGDPSIVEAILSTSDRDIGPTPFDEPTEVVAASVATPAPVPAPVVAPVVAPPPPATTPADILAAARAIQAKAAAVPVVVQAAPVVVPVAVAKPEGSPVSAAKTESSSLDKASLDFLSQFNLS